MKFSAFGFFITFLTLSLYSQEYDLSSSMKRGRSLYIINCQSCHMAAGQGVRMVFPPLVKSDNIANKTRMIQVTRLGMKGLLEVNGVKYKGEMNAIPLSDREIADVLNYVRNSWGNKYPVIRPEEVQPALKAPKGDYQTLK